jgi:hypothetical protein
MNYIIEPEQNSKYRSKISHYSSTIFFFYLIFIFLYSNRVSILSIVNLSDKHHVCLNILIEKIIHNWSSYLNNGLNRFFFLLTMPKMLKVFHLSSSDYMNHLLHSHICCTTIRRDIYIISDTVHIIAGDSNGYSKSSWTKVEAYFSVILKATSLIVFCLKEQNLNYKKTILIKMF